MSVPSGNQPVVDAWRERLTMIATSAGTLAVLDRGSGAAVVMLHGIPTHSYVWRDVARIVAVSQRMVAPDLLGFGFSDKPEHADLSPMGQADAISELLDGLEIESYALVGHDYGALVACELLARDPERVTHLTLTNTSLQRPAWTSTWSLSPLSWLKLPLVGEAAMTLAQPFMLKQAFSIYVAERECLTDETMVLYWHPFDNGFDRTLLRLARESRLYDDAFHRWKAALHAYTRPALVVWGALDPTFRLDQAHEIVNLLPDCRFEVFKHSNHFIQEDRPQALGRLVTAFVEGYYKG
ncbi:MAG TPA: alpha/beta fold hydrolase [Chloroflexota bacterium]|nr:alpha/beta fold hydrolase [Chloroflexota bacterium]